MNQEILKIIENIESIPAIAREVESMGHQIESMGRKIDSMECRLDSMERRLDSVERRLDSMERRLDSVERRLDSVERRLDSIECEIGAMREEQGRQRNVLENLQTDVRSILDIIAPALKKGELVEAHHKMLGKHEGDIAMTKTALRDHITNKAIHREPS